MDNTSDAKANCSQALAEAQMNGWAKDKLDGRCKTPQCNAALLSGFITAPSQSEGVTVSVRKHTLIVLAEFKPDSMSNLN